MYSVCTMPRVLCPYLLPSICTPSSRSHHLHEELSSAHFLYPYNHSPDASPIVNSCHYTKPQRYSSTNTNTPTQTQTLISTSTHPLTPSLAGPHPSDFRQLPCGTDPNLPISGNYHKPVAAGGHFGMRYQPNHSRYSIHCNWLTLTVRY